MPWNPDGTRKKPSTYRMKYQGNHSAFPFKKFDKFETFEESSESEDSKEVFEKSMDETEKIKERAKDN